MQGFDVDLKSFTRKLFLETVFDSFLVPEANFATSFTSSFDGGMIAEIPEEPYISWAVLRPIAYALIKGKTLPKSFRIVFMLSKKKTQEFLLASRSDFAPEEVGGLFLNVRYSGDNLQLTTGCALKQFSVDRSLELSWDKWVAHFLDTLS